MPPAFPLNLPLPLPFPPLHPPLQLALPALLIAFAWMENVARDLNKLQKSFSLCLRTSISHSWQHLPTPPPTSYPLPLLVLAPFGQVELRQLSGLDLELAGSRKVLPFVLFAQNESIYLCVCVQVCVGVCVCECVGVMTLLAG